MREILFRGKKVDNGEWVYGAYNNICENTIIDIADITHMRIDVIPKTVGQYTGLNDKNGKKIFEGDILKTKFGTVLISFDRCRGFGGYSNRRRQDGSLIYLAGLDLEHGDIIGNILDNPELMEVINEKDTFADSDRLAYIAET